MFCCVEQPFRDLSLCVSLVCCKLVKCLYINNVASFGSESSTTANWLFWLFFDKSAVVHSCRKLINMPPSALFAMCLKYMFAEYLLTVWSVQTGRMQVRSARLRVGGLCGRARLTRDGLRARDAHRRADPRRAARQVCLEQRVAAARRRRLRRR